MKNTKKIIGKYIKYYRKKRRLTQEELAHRAGIHPSYLSYVEIGKKAPSLSTLEHLSKALKVPIQAFLGPVQETKIPKYDSETEQLINIMQNASLFEKDFIKKALELINKKKK